MIRRTPLLIAMLVLGPALAGAQETPPTGRFNLGPSVTFTPAVVFVAGTDSNLGRSLDAEGGEEFYVVPQFEGWVGRGRVRLNVAGAMEYGRTSVNKSQLNHRYEGRLDSSGRRVAAYALAAHGDIFAPPSDFVGFELGIRSRRVQDVFEGGITLTPQGRLRYGVAGRRSRLRYDADARYEGASLQFNLNRDIDTIQGDVDVLVTPLSSAGVTTILSRDSFLFAPERDGDGYAVLGGFKLATRALMAGRAQGGVMRYTTKQTNISYGGPTYNLGLAMNRPPVVVDVSGTRRIDFSFNPDRGFYITSGIDAFSALIFRTKWEIFARGSWRRLTPRGPRALEESNGTLQIYKAGVARGMGSFAKIGIEGENYVARGPAPFTARRAIVFITYGTTRLQRLDRPLPGEF